MCCSESRQVVVLPLNIPFHWTAFHGAKSPISLKLSVFPEIPSDCRKNHRILSLLCVTALIAGVKNKLFAGRNLKRTLIGQDQSSLVVGYFLV